MNNDFKEHIREVNYHKDGIEGNIDDDDREISNMLLKLCEIRALKRIGDTLDKIYQAMNHA